jgi:hypothetical protein
MKTQYKVLQLRGAVRATEVRTARHEDREWIVVPCIALVGDIVVRPMGSEGPEFAPAAVVAEAPDQWKGRPVIPDHPTDSTGPISANEPRILESQVYGKLFNPKYEGGRLKLEAWLDPDRARKIGGDALRVLKVAERALEGEEVEPIEVSVGVTVQIIEEGGVAPNGDRYEWKWQHYWSDHLAVGLNGAEGACSVNVGGCGAFRSARAAVPEGHLPALRKAVEAALRETVGEFVRVVELRPESLEVVYETAGEVPGTWLRGYTWDEAARAVDLDNFALPVEPEKDPKRGAKQPSRRTAFRGATPPEVNVKDKKKAPAPASEAGEKRGAVSDENLRNWIHEALVEVEGDAEYVWVEAIDQAEGSVVYTVRYDNDASCDLYRRTFSLDGETVTIGDERARVRRRVEYEEAPEEQMEGARGAAGLIRKLAAVLGIRQAQEDEGVSDVDLREMLWKALRASVPGFHDIYEVKPSTALIVYTTIPEDDIVWWRQTFALDEESGTVALNDDAEQVEPVTQFEPVVAKVTEPTQAELDFQAAEKPCACKSEKTAAKAAAGSPGEGLAARTQNAEGAEEMSDKAKQKALSDLIGRLIALEASPFTEDDREHLEAFGGDRLRAMEETYADPPGDEDGDDDAAADEPDAEAPAAPAEEPESDGAAAPADGGAPPAETVTLSREEVDEMRAASRAWKRQQDERKEGLVAELRGAQGTYAEKRLRAMSLEQLEEVAELVGLNEEETVAPAAAPAARRDYSGRGYPRSAAAEADEDGPPRPYTRALEARRERKEAN